MISLYAAYVVKSLNVNAIQIITVIFAKKRIYIAHVLRNKMANDDIKAENMVESNISIVFTDIIGSTKFVQDNGAKKAAVWFMANDKLVMNLITRFNGKWVDNSDGHLIYFNSIQDSISFAFEYKKKLRSNKFPFRSRVGIHWDTMIITKTSQNLVRGGVKKINLEGIGKNIAARTMSICKEEQILITEKAYKKFLERTYENKSIPKDAKYAFIGLYKFKGVDEPESVYALGLEESHLQPPADSEKAKRVGGKAKVKVRLRNKKIKEIVEYFFWRISIIIVLLFLLYLFPFFSSKEEKQFWNCDYLIFKPFEYIKLFFEVLKKLL